MMEINRVILIGMDRIFGCRDKQDCTCVCVYVCVCVCVRRVCVSCFREVCVCTKFSNTSLNGNFIQSCNRISADNMNDAA